VDVRTGPDERDGTLTPYPRDIKDVVDVIVISQVPQNLTRRGFRDERSDVRAGRPNSPGG
jgi:hypothetical protein